MSYTIQEPNDIKLCDYWTWRFTRSMGISLDEDQYQTGRLGLCRAAENYDEQRDKGKGFWGYAPTVIKRTLVRENFNNSGNGRRTHSCIYRNKSGREFHESEHPQHPNLEKQVINRQLINNELKTMYPKVAKAVIDKAFWDIDYSVTGVKLGMIGRSMGEMVHQWRTNFRGYGRLTDKIRQKKYWNGYEIDLYKLATEDIEGMDAE